MTNKLVKLKSMTTVVADTGDINAIKKYQPIDATTNPSLLLKAAQMEEYQPLLISSLEATKDGTDGNRIANACDHLAVAIGCEVLKLIPGRVSTEVDARLSFNTQATINKA